MIRNQVSFDDFKHARNKMYKRIEDELNKEFVEIAGWPAGKIIDINICFDRHNIVGIRLDNNFGIVNGTDAIRFAEALAFAARIAAEFEYLDWEIVDR